LSIRNSSSVVALVDGLRRRVLRDEGDVVGVIGGDASSSTAACRIGRIEVRLQHVLIDVAPKDSGSRPASAL